MVLREQHKAGKLIIFWQITGRNYYFENSNSGINATMASGHGDMPGVELHTKLRIQKNIPIYL